MLRLNQPSTAVGTMRTKVRIGLEPAQLSPPPPCQPLRLLIAVLIRGHRHVIGTRTDGPRWLSNLVEEPSHARFTFRRPCRAGHPLSRQFGGKWTRRRQGRVGPQHIVDAIWLSLGLTRGISDLLNLARTLGSSEMVMPGQVVPKEVPIFIRPDASRATLSQDSA